MTLSTLLKTFRSFTPEPPKIYIFRDEESADHWIMDKYFSGKFRDYELLAVFQSDHNPEVTLKEKWCTANVAKFFAVEPDALVIVIEEESDEDTM